MACIEINGVPATADALHLPALNTYGHFTAMQVRDGRVRGLALHLGRLDASARELFGQGVDGERVREYIRGALDAAEVRDASVRVNVYWPDGDERATLMVTVRPPQTMAEGPKSLMSVPFVREVPHIKHLGSFGQNHYLTLAGRAGFDEALLTAPDGLVTEGAITNIAFWDGSSVVWPDAPSLLGMTMALLEPRLPSVRRRVTLADLPSYEAAFITNSQGFAPVRRIDDVEYAVDEELMRTVTAAYDAVGWDLI
ncbi:aminotransferase class IV family protein [Streptomyces lunaelactis]|uniref:aminotransferase class IV family protein n=1 Tax=Streptomyces lunaelactis TaxID=1535768 RepID=UPI001584888D|nr:aminotransferase class IV family protein [Streptomyces lunaelactis]NUK59106.1 aminotransferase class IV family protein [Streptomyces lunaelactis]